MVILPIFKFFSLILSIITYTNFLPVSLWRPLLHFTMLIVLFVEQLMNFSVSIWTVCQVGFINGNSSNSGFTNGYSIVLLKSVWICDYNYRRNKYYRFLSFNSSRYRCLSFKDKQTLTIPIFLPYLMSPSCPMKDKIIKLTPLPKYLYMYIPVYVYVPVYTYSLSSVKCEPS